MCAYVPTRLLLTEEQQKRVKTLVTVSLSGRWTLKILLEAFLKANFRNLYA